MAELSPYKRLEFTVTRLMMDDIPGVTHKTLELAGKGLVDVIAKISIGQDGGWHRAFGAAHYQKSGRTFFEEHSQRPLFNSAEVDPHICSPIGCSCYSLHDGNILYGMRGEVYQTQAPEPDALAQAIGRTVAHGLSSRQGLDIFGTTADEGREWAVIRMMRGPLESANQLFMDTALALAVDTALGLNPQESRPTDAPIA